MIDQEPPLLLCMRLVIMRLLVDYRHRKRMLPLCRLLFLFFASNLYSLLELMRAQSMFPEQPYFQTLLESLHSAPQLIEVSLHGWDWIHFHHHMR